MTILHVALICVIVHVTVMSLALTRFDVSTSTLLGLSAVIIVGGFLGTTFGTDEEAES